MLGEIRSGAFTADMIADAAAGGPRRRAAASAAASHPIEEVRRKLLKLKR